MTTPGLTEVADKLADLVKRAPAGGVFHDAEVFELSPDETAWPQTGFQIVMREQGRAYQVIIKPGL